MTCKFHPNIELVILPSEDTLSGQRMRCPQIVDDATGRLCPHVDVEFDPERIEKRYCARCKKRLYDEVLGNNPVCNACRNSYRKRLTT